MSQNQNSENVQKNPNGNRNSKLSGRAVLRVQRKGFLNPGMYLKYIDYLRTKQTTGITEVHHIIPKHKGGTDDSSNLIRIGARDHILAHVFLFLEEGRASDLKAFTLRLATQDVDLQSQGKMIALANQLAKKGWFNSIVQCQLGRIGGPIGGSRNTPEQWNARSQVGQTYGRITGLGNQSTQVKNILANFLLFQHKESKNEVFVVPPQAGVIDVANFLNEECDKRNLGQQKMDLTKVKKGGPFYPVIRGEKKSAYGWEIIEMIPFEIFED